jgi:hypothetical protein
VGGWATNGRYFGSAINGGAESQGTPWVALCPSSLSARPVPV